MQLVLFQRIKELLCEITDFLFDMVSTFVYVKYQFALRCLWVAIGMGWKVSMDVHENAIDEKRVNKINANFDRSQSFAIYGNNQNQWHCQMWRIHYVCMCVRVKSNHLISRESFIQFSMSTHMCVLFISFEIPIDLCAKHLVLCLPMIAYAK